MYTRYFMTIPEAAQLVLQAGIMARGGEVFVLDMGEPVRVFDLAKNMIELSGLSIRSADNPDGDIEIEVVGLRPGEKLFEELLIGNDPTATGHPRIMMASETFLPWTMLGPRLALLTELLDRQDAASVRTLIAELVPEYRAGKLNDWISAACQAFDRGVVSLGAHRGKQPRLASAARKPTPAIS